MTRRELIQAFLPITLYKQKPAPEIVPAKAMDKHCPVCGIKGDDVFNWMFRTAGTRIIAVQMYLCQQCGCIFGYDKNDAGGK